mgnify:CR=1 FL=1
MHDDTPKNSVDTRSRILDAAEVLFMEHGFDGTSMRMITSQAGVNLAAVNYHFGTKELLMQISDVRAHTVRLDVISSLNRY